MLVMGVIGAGLVAVFVWNPEWNPGQSMRPYIITSVVAWAIALAARIADTSQHAVDSRNFQRRGASELIESLRDMKSRHERLVFQPKSEEDQISLAMKTFDVLGQQLRRLRLEELTLPDGIDTGALAGLLTKMFLAVEFDDPPKDLLDAYRSQASGYQAKLKDYIGMLETERGNLRGQ
jgi:hypothetical protein